MGREAVCTCDWAGEVTEVKALLETNELILRGGLRKKLPFDQLQGVRAVEDRLCFRFGGERVELTLGVSNAESWATKVTTPAPSLAKKLGITGSTSVRVVGAVCDEELQQALNGAAKTASKSPDLVIACVKSSADLQRAFEDSRKDLLKGTPLWIVYAKGKGQAINETEIRSLLRSHGVMDTKVASVSAKFTALRFNLQKSK